MTPELPANQTLKGRIEAVLFITGRALSLADISEIIGAPVEDVELAMMELMSDISFREGSALEIDDTDGYILQVREEYGDIVNKMMPLELSAAEIRTLSAIALKAPVLQSDLIEWRGASAYDHIANLLKHKLVSKRRDGRSYQLNVTRHFYEYFKLVGDKKELSGLVQLIGKEEGESKTVAELPDDLDAVALDAPEAEAAMAEAPVAEGGEMVLEVAAPVTEPEPGEKVSLPEEMF